MSKKTIQLSDPAGKGIEGWEDMSHRERIAALRRHPPVGIKKDADNPPSKSEPGRNKGENCQASKRDRLFAKRNRSYRYPGYGDWCRRMDKLN